jgi:hypothetical protein
VKRCLQSGLAKALAGIVIVGLAGTWALGAVRDKHEVARMTEQMKTVCVGRLLIDMPVEAQIKLTRQRIDGFDIAAFDESREDFRTRLAAREAEIRARPDRNGGNKNMESATEVKTDSGFVGKIFVHTRTVSKGQSSDGLSVEHYRYEGIAVEALVHADGVSIDLVTNDYDAALIENLPKLVAKLVPNPGDQIPSEPGFCIGRAYFRDPLTADQGEEIMMFARLPSRPDIRFSLILAAGTPPDTQGLLERGADSDARMAVDDKVRVSKLRAAPRTIGGLAGDELGERCIERNDAVVYSFWWEVNGTEDDVFVPHIVFTMETGNSNNGPVPSSLSQGAAAGLWDTVSSSIRLRHTELPKSSAARPPAPPIGTYVSAGDRCPLSGWWACTDGGNGIGVLGGQRQYIKQGERMPQALLLPPPTLWEKVRGLQPSFESETRTSWKLVDKRGRKRIAPTLPLAKATVVAPATTTAAGAGPRVMEEQRVPVGSFAATGLPCPASGWWRCEESHALDGTRWFAQGNLLPSATFAVPPGVFGRSAGSPKSIQRRGTWRLVRLAHSAEQAGSGAAGDKAGENTLLPPAQDT